MKLRFSLYFFTLCLLLAFAGCKHKKSGVSKQKKNKQTLAKAPPTSAKSPATSVKDNSATFNGVFGQKMGLSQKEVNNSKLFVFISDWYGVPYKYGGCAKTGVDCSCFTNLLYEKVYNKKTGRSADEMYKTCEKVLLTEVREGDLIFFKIGGSFISHVGVYLRNSLFVHSSTSKGVIINSIDEAYYKKYFHSGGRLKNI